jgi:Flp pilus assembly protein TadD
MTLLASFSRRTVRIFAIGLLVVAVWPAKLFAQQMCPKFPEETPQLGDLLDSAYAAMQARDYFTARRLYKQAVSLQPQQSEAWNNLGRAELRLGLAADALRTLKTGLEVNPCDDLVRRNLFRAYVFNGDTANAESSCREQLRLWPADNFCHFGIGTVLVQQKKYTDAIRELEMAAPLAQQEVTTYVWLGIARLNTGDHDGAMADFRRAGNLAAIPYIWTAVAHALVEHHVHSDDAITYARSAVDGTTALLKESINQQHYSDAWKLSEELVYAWEVLGLAYFDRNEPKLAEQYELAAWNTGLSAKAANNLAAIYEETGQQSRAQELATAARSGMPDTTVTLATAASEDEADDIWVVLDSSGAVTDAKFVGAEPRLVRFLSRIKQSRFAVSLPDDGPSFITRRGRVTCSKDRGACLFGFFPAGFAESVSDAERLLAGVSR